MASSSITFKLKSLHDESYLYLDQAISCDECRQGEQAMTLYNKAVRSITKALDMYEELCQTNPSAAATVEEMVTKMRRTVTQVHSRVEELLLSQGAIVEIDSDDTQLPSYAQATNGNAPPLYSSLSMNDNTAAMANATRLFYVADGVQVFFIDANEYVSAPSYPSSLAVFQFSGNDQRFSTSSAPPASSPTSPVSTPLDPSGSLLMDNQSAPAFLQVGDWLYPLLPGHSPVLQSNWGAYMFPDVTATEEGCSVGVILPDTVDVVERTKFEKLLRSLTDLRQQQLVTTSEQIAKGLSTAADWISWGLNQGAEKTKSLVEYGSTALRERLEPNQSKSSIDPRAQCGARYARTATGVAVRVSSYLVSKVGNATVALGQKMAPHIRRHSENLLPASFTRRDSSTGKSTLDGVAEVTVSGLQGFGKVYEALENSAKILAKSIADQTVQVVQHKFGDDAGQFTEQVVSSAGNIAMTSHNVGNLGVKAIAKRVAKDTGRAVAEDTIASTASASSVDDGVRR